MKLNLNNQILEFKPISIGDKDAFRQMPNDIEHISCEYSFANLFMWGESYDMQWCNFNDAPLVLIAKEDVLLFPLCQEMSYNKLKSLSQSFIEAGGSGAITQVPEEFIKANPELNDLYEIREDRNFADYLHLTKKLCELSGRKLSKKRNLISQFIKNYSDFKDLPLTAELFDDCLELLQKNMLDNNTEHHKELLAIQKGFANFAKLELGGRAIQYFNKVIAFAVFSHHIDGSFLIHYKKSNYSFKGAAQMINWKTAAFLTDKCEYINREQDLGIPGLGKAKLSYDPEKILINYELRPNYTLHR